LPFKYLPQNDLLLLQNKSKTKKPPRQPHKIAQAEKLECIITTPLLVNNSFAAQSLWFRQSRTSYWHPCPSNHRFLNQSAFDILPAIGATMPSPPFPDLIEEIQKQTGDQHAEDLKQKPRTNPGGCWMYFAPLQAPIKKGTRRRPTKLGYRWYK